MWLICLRILRRSGGPSIQPLFEKECPMRNSTLRAITASVAAVAMIVSVGTSPVLARGGGGHGGAGGVRAGGGGHGFHAGGGFHPGGHTYAHGYHRGYYGGGYYGGGYYGGYGCAANPIPLLNVVSPYWCG
jgi:hypothetical protein